MTKQEALDAIAQCHKLRKSIDRLLIKANRALKMPDLKLVESKHRGTT